ncbi:response regulator [Pedobacter frigiditerrae]|uniref:response regulator n=1 Tax=Pedobacter frigiditerrae TaxID=2530452 RepID=UPI002930781D|nr:response regulator [Pedobacter frigiditerrae]
MIKLNSTIMIVDDNIIDQMITTRVLKNSYSQSDVLVMDCPIKALSYLESNEDNIASLPSLIILDLDMPEMNGLGFLERFSEFADKLKDAIKIVVLTATDVMEDIELASANPAVSKLISKPLFNNSLAEML